MRIERFLHIICLALVCITLIQCSDSSGVEKPNVLLICIDDLRPELNSFGKSYIHSPNIDNLANKGISFLNHYVNAPSCGPSRYTLLTGRYGPAGNNALFQRADELMQGRKEIRPSMPEWFRANGYTTVSVGKVSHHPGGRGGSNWDDHNIIEMPNAWDRHIMPSSEWMHPRGAMHGLAHGEIRKNAEDMDVFQSVEGGDEIYPDGKITEEAINQLGKLTEEGEKPFFLAVGIIRPHLPFGSPKKYFSHYEGIDLPSIEHPQKPEERSTWHKSGEFMKYNRWGNDMYENHEFADEVRRHYAACVSYADAQVGEILEALQLTGKEKNTIIVLWGDHGWHLGEHAIWGKHSLFEESLHSPLIIHNPGMIDRNAKTKAIVETLDIFPTLCELTGIDIPSFTEGKSLKPYFNKLNAKGHEVVAYNRDAKTIRTSDHRLVLHEDGYVELYSHLTEEAETKNIASMHPDLVQKLKAKLKEKLN